MNTQKGIISLGLLIAIILGLLVVGGGAYYVGHQNAAPETTVYQDEANTPPVTQTTTRPPINTNPQPKPVTQPTAATVGVSGMTKYTDTDFGFSFWYPSSDSVTNAGEKIVVSGNGNEIDIQKVTSSDLSYKIPVGACGTCEPKTYYFDTAQHLWMMSTSPRDNYAPASGGQPADISKNTMGGLHIFYGQDKDLNRIVPLSARNFLSISDAAGWQGAPDEDAKLLGLTKTIVATDPSVATPVSAAEQNKTIQAEATAFGQ
jgi:hypothetical protein